MFEILLAAQQEIPIGGNQGGFGGIGPLGLENIRPEDAPRVFATVISNILAFMTIVGVLWFTFMVFIAGYNWLASGGDKQKLGDARAKLSAAVFGLVLVVIAIFFVRLITTLLGIEIALDPIKAVQMLTPR